MIILIYFYFCPCNVKLKIPACAAHEARPRTQGALYDPRSSFLFPFFSRSEEAKIVLSSLSLGSARGLVRQGAFRGCDIVVPQRLSCLRRYSLRICTQVSTSYVHIFTPPYFRVYTLYNVVEKSLTFCVELIPAFMVVNGTENESVQWQLEV